MVLGLRPDAYLSHAPQGAARTCRRARSLSEVVALVLLAFRFGLTLVSMFVW